MNTYQELIRQAAGGNQNAFSELVRRFSSMAKALALQRLHDPALAEDAVQESFLAAWLHLPGLRNPEAFPGWLRSIVTRSCHRVLRSTLPGVLASDLENIDSIPAEDTDPFEHYARFQTRDMVLTFLAALSGVYREAPCSAICWAAPTRRSPWPWACPWAPSNAGCTRPATA